MNKFLSTLIFITLLMSCTFVEVIDSVVDDIDLSELSPQNIDSKITIINIQADQAEFDNMHGNPEQEIEIEAFIEIWRTEGSNKTKVLEPTLIELDIKGSASALFELKSLGIKFDNTADNSKSNIFNPISKIRPNVNFGNIKSIRARNSGNDFYETMMKDISYSNLATNLGLDFESGYFEPAHIFVNSNYYGLLNLRTEKNQNGLSRQFGVKKDDISQIKINSHDSPTLKGVDKKPLNDYLDAIESGDLDYVEANTDISSFFDYMIFQDIIGNSDWPHNNALLYFNAKSSDKRFRFFLYDLDLAGNLEHFLADRKNEDIILINLYRLLVQNPDTDALFKRRHTEIFNSIKVSDFDKIVDDNTLLIEDDIKYQIKMYNIPGDRLIWYNNIVKLKKNFKARNEAYIDKFNL
ncbi:MAG: CotH kinase family protein [Flavobacteriales bacterium]|nr:CotH kinase family protein [Flavobacteriales bacterium]